MTFREKLADWISGGELTLAYKLSNADFDKTYNTMRQLERSVSALRNVAAQEKPTSNATVKRMARMAREALGE